MLLRIDNTSPDPIYLQIRNQILEGIATGQLRPGDGLPSVRTLASDLGVNLHTVNKAYAVLRDEGYLLMRGRSGAYVAEPLAESSPARASLAHDKLSTHLKELVCEYKAAGGDEASFLDEARAIADAVYGNPGVNGAQREVRLSPRFESGEQAAGATDAPVHSDMAGGIAIQHT